MPTYVYKCAENEHITEIKQRFSDPPLDKCPECGGGVRKLINSVGIVFKGKGFYVTDNRGNNSAAPGKGGGEDGGSDAKSAESSTPSKDGDSGVKADSSSKKGSKTEAKPAKKAVEKSS